MGEQSFPDSHGTEAVVEAVGEEVRLAVGSTLTLSYTTAQARELAAALVEAASQLEALRLPEAHDPKA